MVLLPMIEKFTFQKRKLKLLEIGLGCDMEYGPGSSVRVWQKIGLGHDVEIWEAEKDELCVRQSQEKGQLKGINVLVGDQARHDVLEKWVKESGGNFDVIIDDGGHRNDMILNSITALWPTINPGGWYFVEDLEISFDPPFLAAGYPHVTVVMQSWVETLHVGLDALSRHHRHLADRFPLPKGCDVMLCQKSACALHKEEAILGNK